MVKAQAKQNLEGHLNLSDFINLEELNCILNQLTELSFDGLTHLKNFYCRNNYLTNLDFLNNLNQEELTNLSIRNNNLPKQDLSVFSRFVNLKELHVGNDEQEKIKQGIHNRFTSSLKALKNLTKLRILDVSNTDIDSGLEYLPDSIEELKCSNQARPESKVSKISEQLAPSGLKINEWHFATYLKQKGCNPSQTDKIEELKVIFPKEYQQAQTWLDFNYPQEEREKVTELNISHKNLSGLEELKEIRCNDNYLTSFDYSILNADKLILLNIGNNNLSEQNLTVFSRFVNLETLEINNGNKEHLTNNIYNKFIGSLEPLSNLMSKLKRLDISNTDIDSGYEYLPNNENYPQEQRSETSSIYLNEPSLEGELDLKDFANNWRFTTYISTLVNETKLIFKNTDPGNFPDNKRLEGSLKLEGFSNLEKLDCCSSYHFCGNNLITRLEIINCPKLEEIQCQQNKLTELILQDCPNLKGICCHSNLLSNLDLSQNKKLEQLNIRSNNFTEQDLKFLSHLVNLRSLEIGNRIDKSKRIDLKFYNRFVGSLELLKNLTRLEKLEIIDTDLDGGLEYLSDSVDICQPSEAHLADYLREKGYEPQQLPANLSELKQDRNLHGTLIIQDFPQLETIYCDNNQLTNLEISNCPNLWQLVCDTNELTNLNFLDNINPEKLTHLCINENKFQLDLNFLSKFTNLEYLLLNDNSLNGSLKSLESCLKLEKLDIRNTNITEGLEYLPKSLEEIHCTENNQELVAKVQARILLKDEFQAQTQKIQELQEQLTNLQNKYRQNLQIQQSSLQELEQEKLTLETKLKDAINETTTLQQQADKLQQELGSAADNYQKLAIELAEKKDNSPTLDEKELREAEAEIERLEKALLGAKNDLEEKKKQVLDLQKNLVDKSREIKKVQAEKQIELDALQAEKEILQLDFDSLQGKLKKNEEDLGNKKKELAVIKKKLKEQLQQAKSLELTRSLRRNEKGSQSEINVSQGHAMIGNTMKDDTNLKKQELTKLIIKEKNLEGELKITDFVNLEEFNCYENSRLTSLKIENCPKLRKLNCFCNGLIELSLNSQALLELEEFDCKHNQLTKLDISKCRNLKKFNCSHNNLTTIDLSNLNSESLTDLDLSNNNLSQQNLTLFARFVNLKKLKIGSHVPSKINQNVYNRFYGSLEFLQGLTKLELLSIESTDVDEEVADLRVEKLLLEEKVKALETECKKQGKSREHLEKTKEQLTKIIGKQKELSTEINLLNKDPEKSKEELRRLVNKVKDKLDAGKFLGNISGSNKISTKDKEKIREKAEELFRIISSREKVFSKSEEETKQQLDNKKWELGNVKTKESRLLIKKTKLELKGKKEELNQLRDNNNIKFNETLDNLLSAQTAVIRENSFYAKDLLVIHKKKAEECFSGNKKKVEIICQKQTEITKLEMQLEKLETELNDFKEKNIKSKQQVKELKSEIQKESKNIRQYLKEISWNNVATTTQTVAGVASVVISIVPLCRIM
ncbi:15476_t:CDS:10 [Entrophospora sp. SA101]|nr:15476_t:CDS:10 [Entrophospora sp. SA101]